MNCAKIDNGLQEKYF